MNKNYKILVVEDDAPVRKLITTTLKAHVYRYDTAADGKNAVMGAVSHNPDIILLDLGLPDMDGVEVIKRIRSWSNVPIIVISFSLLILLNLQKIGIRLIRVKTLVTPHNRYHIGIA